MLTSAARRRVFGDYQSTEPSRFIDEIPARADRGSAVHLRVAVSVVVLAVPRRLTGGATPPAQGKSAPSYAYEDEDQSVPAGLKPGPRVRHPKFGVGTVLSVEPLDDDTKLVVRFTSVGQKTLRAKFAKLEVA